MKYSCPVCGYSEMDEAPENDAICPSCGTHFGYHDFSNTYDELRALWFEGGAQWFSPVDSKPPQWSALKQLDRAGLLKHAGGMIAPDLQLTSHERPVTVRFDFDLAIGALLNYKPLADVA